MDASGWPFNWVVDRMRELSLVMRRQTRAVYEEDVAVIDTEFKPDFAGRWMKHAESPARVSDGVTAQTIKYAYGAGAGVPGVENVPGPMGGGAGYIYAALSAVQEARGLSDDDLLRGLFIAAGVGAIAYTRTDPTGEVLGCTGESGVCGAMAAAAIAEMVGGSPEAVENAGSLALQAFTGLPCDPMPGGLSQPCRSRIMAATCMAARLRGPGSGRPRGRTAAARGDRRGRRHRPRPAARAAVHLGGRVLRGAGGTGPQGRVPALVRREPPGGQAPGQPDLTGARR